MTERDLLPALPHLNPVMSIFSPKNNPVLVTKSVSDSCFDFLYLEMVQHFIQQSSHQQPITEHFEEQLASPEGELVYFKLEKIGYQVGQVLIERLSRDKPRFQDHLECVKFICKEFWQVIFKKQIDNLKTNHRGVFVLQDNQFRWFMSSASAANLSTTPPEIIKKMTPFLAFPCGLIRGALSNLGIQATVSAEIVSLPQCTFKLDVPIVATGR